MEANPVAEGWAANAFRTEEVICLDMQKEMSIQWSIDVATSCNMVRE